MGRNTLGFHHTRRNHLAHAVHLDEFISTSQAWCYFGLGNGRWGLSWASVFSCAFASRSKVVQHILFGHTAFSTRTLDA